MRVQWMQSYKSNILKFIRFRLWSFVKKSVLLFLFSGLLLLLLNIIFPLRITVSYSTTIYDSAGDIANAFLTPDEKWRMKTELHELSPLLRKAIVAKEDKYFYSHPGVNPFAVARALLNNLLQLKRTSGASTITMQVARALEHRKRTWGAKIVEMFRAIQLEWYYSKDEILQLYLNLVPYGGNIEGVKAASLIYFQQNPNQLSLAQIVTLSIIPNRPSSLVIGKNNDAIVQQRNKWLHYFSKNGVFTKKEIQDALQEPLNAFRSAVPHYVPHLSFYLKNKLRDVNIHTWIDMNKQKKCEKITRDYVQQLKIKGIQNAAVMVIDNNTHKVVTYIGSADFTDNHDGGQVNGIRAVRQPGSTLKPFLYGLCIDQGLLTPKTVLNDVPVNYGAYNPENFDRRFNGAVTMEYALDHSLNIPAVKALQSLGLQSMISSLISARFRQIEKDRNKLGLSLILGGCGASLEELTGLFAAFADQGKWTQPLLTAHQQKSDTTILSAAASFMITDILSKVNRPDFPLSWTATENMPKIAWKTGTSYGRRDAWSIGYNKQYTVGVWCGNFSGVGAPDLTGASIATPLLFRIFNSIDYNNNGDWFQPPATVDFRMVCAESGLPPGTWCTNVVSDFFIPMVSSTNYCEHQKEIKVAVNGKISYCEHCAPSTGFIKKMFPFPAPELEAFYFANAIPYVKAPPHNPLCDKVFKGDGPKILSPKNNMDYYIDKSDPEPIELLAVGGAEVSDLFWYINDRFYKKTKSNEKQFMLLKEGAVKISCSDDKGRTRNIRIFVHY